MWKSRLFRWVVAIDIMFMVIYGYILPTISKAIGQQWSVRTIAVMGVIGTSLGLFQTVIARYVPPRIILYGGCCLGFVCGAGVLVTSSLSLAAGLFACRISWIVVGTTNNNWDALQWEALAKVGPLSQMQTMIGSLCCAASLIGGTAAVIAAPPLELALWMVGVSEVVGNLFAWRIARGVLKHLDSDQSPP